MSTPLVEPSKGDIHIHSQAHLETLENGIDPHLLQLGFAIVEKQKQASFIDGWRQHWRAALWSIVISTALIMEGYDTSVVNSFFGLPQFVQRFGVYNSSTKKYSLPASSQSTLSNLATVGQLGGLIITGFCQERYGLKRTFVGGMVFMTAAVFLAFFAQNLGMLLAAELIMGIPWGMFQTLTTAYASEICPLNMRGYLAAYASACWGIGKFLATGVLRAVLNVPGDLGWQIPYAVQWVWPVPLAVAVLFAPESPWWLVRRGRFDEAQRVVRSTADRSTYTDDEVAGYVEFMKHTDALDRAEHAQGSWLDMFRGTNLRRTEIQVACWSVQNWNGSGITGLTVELLEEAGMSAQAAFDLNLLLNAFSLLGVALSWIALRFSGRRAIYILGIICSVAINLPIGILGSLKPTASILNTIGALMILINFTFHATIGPVCYSIVGELPASRLRVRSVAFGRFIYVVNGIIIGTLNPYMVAAWGWKAKTAFFWLGTGTLCLVWAWFRLPETGGLSFAELDILFANRISSRKFTSKEVRDELLKPMVPVREPEVDVDTKDRISL